MPDHDGSEGPDDETSTTLDGGHADAPPERVIAAQLDEDSTASSSWWRWCIVAGVAVAVLAIADDANLVGTTDSLCAAFRN